MGRVAPVQWLGHASGALAAPPLCAGGVAKGSWFLWADPTLSPGVPRAHFTELQFARAPAPAAARARPFQRRLHVARLRRHKPQEALVVAELLSVEEYRESIGSKTHFRGPLDLYADADAGDVLALAGPCDDSPVAAVRPRAGPGSDALRGLFFSLGAGPPGPGLRLDPGEAARSGPPAWSLGFASLPAGGRARGGGALQVLARVREDAKCMGEQVLQDSLRTFSHRCEWARRYPLYVLHTARLEGVGVEVLLAWTDAVRAAAHPELSLRFLDVSEEFARVRFGDAGAELGELDLLWLDLTSPRSRRIREEKPRRFKVGYRHMCRFHSSTLMDMPSFAGTRYLMHMDEDAALQCHPGDAGPDPLEEMARSGAVYGLFEVGTEDPAYTAGWAGFVEEYSLLHEVRPAVAPELLSTRGALVTKEDDDRPGQLVNATADRLALTWGTAWEVLDLEFFLSPRVREFSEKVERSLGHYRHNWGDHLVRAYQVQLFAPLSSVRCFDAEELPGVHGCSNDKHRMGGEFVYQFVQDLSCPHQWTTEVLYDVPWPPTDSSPRPCLVQCNQLACEGFDIAFFQGSGVAHCILRDGRGDPEACLGGGLAGSAGDSWRRLGIDIEGAHLVGSTNRYQLIERSVTRTFNCTGWREDLAARLRAS